MIFLDDYQIDALSKISNGSVVCGGVGSGKTRVGLGYYFSTEGWKPGDEILPTESPRDLYIITESKKRDDEEWEDELSPCLMSPNPDLDIYNHKVVIDSWNNIMKYQNVYGAFFIFDEQHATGSGAWAKAFLKITSKNRWIMLSATPGDDWEDYIPLFIANGFYRNRTDFKNQHAIYSRYVTSYPKIEGWRDEQLLLYLKGRIMVDLDWKNPAERHYISVPVEFDRDEYRRLIRERCDIHGEPYENAPQMFQAMRKVSNSSPSRVEACLRIVAEHGRAIIFYNFDYELEALRAAEWTYEGERCIVAEYNGHVHEKCPDGYSWVYLVNCNISSTAGWNCISCNTVIFYSQNYSYRITEQACGRIDRRNTYYTDLYYYTLISKSPIDNAIAHALKEKKKFNENGFIRKYVKMEE